MLKLNELESASVFNYFEQISQIPRQSGNEKAISDYLVAFAKENHLEYVQDEYNNVLIRKSATLGYEKFPTVILQAHMDMVCVKKNNSLHDFAKDPIELIIDENLLRAKDTSLGADDGIGVAIILALLESNDISHPDLEAVFTVDEENSMLGAKTFNIKQLQGKILLNIDSDQENCFTCGSASCLISDMHFETESTKNEFDSSYQIEIGGLLGGHSGLEIANEHANAIVLMARVLYKLKSELEINLSEITSGTKHNVIPSNCLAKISFNKTDLEWAENIIDKITDEFKSEFAETEPNLFVNITSLENKLDYALTNNTFEKIICAVFLMPNGLINRNTHLDGIPETSNNLAKICCENGQIIITNSTRSSTESRMDFIFDKLYFLAQIFDAKIEILNRNPAWSYNPNSKLINYCKEIYSQVYHSQPIVTATHGGLECSYFQQIPNVEMISFGPNIHNCHSVDESVEIDSVDRFWRFIKKLLADINSDSKYNFM